MLKKTMFGLGVVGMSLGLVACVEEEYVGTVEYEEVVQELEDDVVNELDNFFEEIGVESYEDDSSVVVDNSVPTEYTNALKKAESYSSNLNMSKTGIYEQLTSDYGEGFSHDAANYAIENLVADYKENALQKAESYYHNMSMSKQSVYEQLVSEYGEGFTHEEAQYAVDNLPE